MFKVFLPHAGVFPFAGFPASALHVGVATPTPLSPHKQNAFAMKHLHPADWAYLVDRFHKNNALFQYTTSESLRSLFVYVRLSPCTSVCPVFDTERGGGGGEHWHSPPIDEVIPP